MTRHRKSFKKSREAATKLKCQAKDDGENEILGNPARAIVGQYRSIPARSREFFRFVFKSSVIMTSVVQCRARLRSVKSGRGAITTANQVPQANRTARRRLGHRRRGCSTRPRRDGPTRRSDRVASARDRSHLSRPTTTAVARTPPSPRARLTMRMRSGAPLGGGPARRPLLPTCFTSELALPEAF